LPARTIVLLSQARRYLVTIERYIRSQAGERTASRAIARIFDKLDHLRIFPEAAPLVPDLDGSPRVAIVRPWRILFE
jgi:plasmid stabilization system protein ParE